MKRFNCFVLVISTMISFSALAGGNGSGNPNNGGGSAVKNTKPPMFVWKDYKLVKNPDTATSKETPVLAKK
ncbi:hypothetical protein [Pseudomonas sp. FSL R10-1339]|uniref:hypothetical protein n=1 Tax=Pseudomonas sp. FSL R10-1339 TaxID=2662196 RepID=UPI00129542FB|nr:hypothetical protein [Pseudomonas sp. FSL R10-1339]MQU54004.1 hypothetical protein [Pseudomonas sp. FSL R10-1339]